MARFRTRGQLLDRLARQANKASTDRARDRAFLDEAWAGPVWRPLTATDAGFGLTRETYTIATTSSTFDLPANFKNLRSIAINPSTDSSPGATRIIPEWVTDKQVERRGSSISNPNVETWGYQTEGPGMDVNDIEYPQRLRFYGDIKAGRRLRISWVTQPRSLANADGTYVDTTGPNQDDSISFDVVDEDVEATLIGWAWLMSTTREDAAEFGRAAKLLDARMDGFLETRRSRNEASPDYLDRHVTGGNSSSNGY